mmetsp:Transcript_4098/g.7915  ORF Transcript_4098/g.7915 Transcript_4098/m.7915 type:complete len:610 (-) Transcript_4098:249-2078(-)|eukprot:CAMPEP_0175141082 /NCGR_PEP_ID=MMETSP0087-20121206/11887_1 /TAXON_ID=136419 /ORGANISM="Unknown Unknown, Strain D1" /LENGTH=609 /DNA_ID=CAMNT_0016424417 /DNA_START=106 /DNA_END=1935 /DNA_ORIENTATION=-
MEDPPSASIPPSATGNEFSDSSGDSDSDSFSSEGGSSPSDEDVELPPPDVKRVANNLRPSPHSIEPSPSPHFSLASPSLPSVLLKDGFSLRSPAGPKPNQVKPKPPSFAEDSFALNADSNSVSTSNGERSLGQRNRADSVGGRSDGSQGNEGLASYLQSPAVAPLTANEDDIPQAESILGRLQSQTKRREKEKGENGENGEHIAKKQKTFQTPLALPATAPGTTCGSRCHHCRNRCSLSDLVFCSKQHKHMGKRLTCMKRFCEGCLRRHYQEKAPSKLDDNNTQEEKKWSCPYCRGVCTCTACKALEERLTPCTLVAYGLVYFSDMLATAMNAPPTVTFTTPYTSTSTAPLASSAPYGYTSQFQTHTYNLNTMGTLPPSYFYNTATSTSTSPAPYTTGASPSSYYDPSQPVNYQQQNYNPALNTYTPYDPTQPYAPLQPGQQPNYALPPTSVGADGSLYSSMNTIPYASMSYGSVEGQAGVSPAPVSDINANGEASTYPVQGYTTSQLQPVSGTLPIAIDVNSLPTSSNSTNPLPTTYGSGVPMELPSVPAPFEGLAQELPEGGTAQPVADAAGGAVEAQDDDNDDDDSDEGDSDDDDSEDDEEEDAEN